MEYRYRYSGMKCCDKDDIRERSHERRCEELNMIRDLFLKSISYKKEEEEERRAEYDKRSFLEEYQLEEGGRRREERWNECDSTNSGAPSK